QPARPTPRPRRCAPARRTCTASTPAAQPPTSPTSASRRGSAAARGASSTADDAAPASRRPRPLWSTSAQRAQARLHVGEGGVAGTHALEQVAGARQVTGALVEVGEGVGAAQVVHLRTLGPAPTLLEEPDRVADLAAVGQRAG